MGRDSVVRNNVPAAPSLIIDAGHYERLVSIAMSAMANSPALAKRLLDELERADLRPSEKVPATVVGIGSDVTFREEGADATRTVRLVFPSDADLERGHVSVLTPLGAALLGLSAGQNIAWEIGGKVKQLEIVAVQREQGASGARNPH